MSRRKRKHKSPKAIAAFQQRDREVRDIYNKLYRMKGRYQYEFVLDIFQQHYFIQEATLLNIMRRVDKEPVNAAQASYNYQMIMNENFKL